MNTEPPQGDDLQRMLVSMKQNVLDRATPRPKRRRGRSGIVIGVVALLAIGTATGAVALTLAQQDQPTAAPAQTQEPEAPASSTPSSAPITATPRPTANPQNTVSTLPTTCRETVPSDDYERFFGDTPVTEITVEKDGSTGTDSADVTWTGGAPTIKCNWADPRADVSGLSLDIGTAGPQAAGELAKSPWECADRDGGRMCQVSVPATPYPVEQTTTFFLRGDTFIVIRQANFPTNGLLDAIVGKIWGD